MKGKSERLEQSLRECNHELATTIDRLDRPDNLLKWAVEEIKELKAKVGVYAKFREADQWYIRDIR